MRRRRRAAPTATKKEEEEEKKKKKTKKRKNFAHLPRTTTSLVITYVDASPPSRVRSTSLPCSSGLTAVGWIRGAVALALAAAAPAAALASAPASSVPVGESGTAKAEEPTSAILLVFLLSSSSSLKCFCVSFSRALGSCGVCTERGKGGLGEKGQRKSGEAREKREQFSTRVAANRRFHEEGKKRKTRPRIGPLSRLEACMPSVPTGRNFEKRLLSAENEL